MKGNIEITYEVNVAREVRTLKRMARNWRRGYEAWLTSDGENDYVYQEFVEEIQMHLLPYVVRMVGAEVLTQEQAKELVEYFLGQIDILKKLDDRIKNILPIALWR